MKQMQLRYNLFSRMGKDNCAKFGSVIPGSGLVLAPFLIRTVLRKMDFLFVVSLPKKKEYYLKWPISAVT